MFQYKHTEGRNIPKNAGTKWSDEHHEEFINMLLDKKDLDVIAEKLERTIGSITARLHIQIYKWIEEENKDINFVMENTPYKSIEFIQHIVNNKRQAAKARERNKEERNTIRREKRKETRESRQDIAKDIEQIKNDIKDLKLMLRGMMNILEELTVEED
tara:strand:- start:43 stop:519 length:477 start_codon:yes stop_codon:yes gene_type:complete